MLTAKLDNGNVWGPHSAWPKQAPTDVRPPLRPDESWTLDIEDMNDRPVVGLAVGADPMKGAAYAGALYMCGLRVKFLDFRKWVVPPGIIPNPVMSAMLSLEGLDGVVFTGGGDIDPRLQKIWQPDPTSMHVNPHRDQFETEVCRQALDDRMPVLGICRGMQMINFTQGGSLYMDIDRDVHPVDVAKGHRQIDRGVAKSEVGHDILIKPASRLAQMFGTTRLGVNSDHHQAVARVGRGLHVTARADDGIVEGIEGDDPDHFVVGVQFHPELMYARDPAFMAPFAAFADAVRARVAAKKAH